MAAIAPEIDRLVWSVRDGVRAERGNLPVSAALSPTAFFPLINLLSFRDHLSESFIRRRYTYRPEAKLQAFFDELESGGYLTRVGDDRLDPTAKFEDVADEISATMSQICRSQWSTFEDLVGRGSDMSRAVMEAGTRRDVLLEVALISPESDEPYRRFWQRLSALRLIRNEAHVEAWRAEGLNPGEVEALTGAWSTPELLQAPVVFTDRLVDLGYVVDGTVTEAGLAARQRIEDATNDGVVGAFSVIDTADFLDIVRTLPPH